MKYLKLLNKWFIIGSIALLFLAIVQFYIFGKADDVEFYKAFVGLVKIIIVGFLIGILGISIPQLLPNKKYDFEIRKEAREKYSEAKTEIDNLPNTLQFIESPKIAQEIVKKIHTQKHLAECYAEFLPERNPNGKDSAEKIWHKGYLPYKRIDACRNTIQDNIGQWEQFPSTERYVKLNKRIKEELEGKVDKPLQTSPSPQDAKSTHGKQIRHSRTNH